MQWNYVVLIFIICLILSIVIKVLVNNKMCQMVYTIELISAFVAIAFHLRNINEYYVLSVLVFFMYRTIIRLISSCVKIIKENKENK